MRPQVNPEELNSVPTPDSELKGSTSSAPTPDSELKGSTSSAPTSPEQSVTSTSTIPNPATQNSEDPTSVAEIGKIEKEISDSPVAAAVTNILETVKIDGGRSEQFNQVKEILDSKESDQAKCTDLEKFFKSEAAVALASKDTSFAAFSAAAQSTLESEHKDSTHQDKVLFVGDLAKNFGYLADKTEGKETTAEMRDLSVAIGKTGENELYGKDAVEKIKGAISPVLDTISQASDEMSEEDKKRKKESDPKAQAAAEKLYENMPDMIKEGAFYAAALIVACAVPVVGPLLAVGMIFGREMMRGDKDKKRILEGDIEPNPEDELKRQQTEDLLKLLQKSTGLSSEEAGKGDSAADQDVSGSRSKQALSEMVNDATTKDPTTNVLSSAEDKKASLESGAVQSSSQVADEARSKKGDDERDSRTNLSSNAGTETGSLEQIGAAQSNTAPSANNTDVPGELLESTKKEVSQIVERDEKRKQKLAEEKAAQKANDERTGNISLLQGKPNGLETVPVNEIPAATPPVGYEMERELNQSLNLVELGSSSSEPKVAAPGALGGKGNFFDSALSTQPDSQPNDAQNTSSVEKSEEVRPAQGAQKFVIEENYNGKDVVTPVQAGIVFGAELKSVSAKQEANNLVGILRGNDTSVGDQSGENMTAKHRISAIENKIGGEGGDLSR